MKKYRISKKYYWNPSKAAANLGGLAARAASSFAGFLASVLLTTAAIYMALLALAALI